MASSVWSGVIAFGMVSIPVRLYTATSNKRVSFHQLHAKCNTRIKEIRWCPSCDREVPWEEIVKGYSFAKDESIPITEADFEKLPLPSKNIIEISSFTGLDQVDPLYFEKNYILTPDKQGLKAFSLFLKALETKSLLAIGKIAIRTRERLCAIRAVGGTLVLCTLLYQDEISVDTSEDAPATKIPRQEMEMALNLIDMMTMPFDPSSYKDDYQEALNDLIQAKLSGKGAKKTKTIKPAAVIDLMEALKASINNAGRGAATAPADRRARNVRVKKAKSSSAAKAGARARLTAATRATAKARTASKAAPGAKAAVNARSRKSNKK